MNRFHVHVAVDDLEANVRFYSAMFGTEPSVRRDDYAKWMLDDPLINFAISKRSRRPGMNHLGIQVESDADLDAMRRRLTEAEIAATTPGRPLAATRTPRNTGLPTRKESRGKLFIRCTAFLSTVKIGAWRQCTQQAPVASRIRLK